MASPVVTLSLSASWMISVALVILWVALAITGDYAIRAYATNAGLWKLALGALCYGATVPVAVLAYRSTSWSLVALLWSCLSLLTSIAVAVFILKEPLTAKRAVSLLLLFIAMGLAE